MKLRIWTLVAALVIIIAFGLALPNMISDKTAVVAVNYEQVKADFKTELIENFAAFNYREPGAADASDVQVTTTQSSDASKSSSPQAEDNAAKDAVDDTEISDDDTPLGNGGNSLFVKDGWINEKINQNREKIDDSDLSRGAAIYNRLDTDFIFGLADGGLTDEERKQVNDYLKSQLEGADYEIAQNLYYKYVGLLNND